MKQKTIKDKIVIKGVGLHTGRKCKAIFLPAPENSGIRFIRTDVDGKPEFRAEVSNVIDIIRGTTLGDGDARVYTIEHVLSALHGFGIDNVTIELDDNEPPVCDGSAKAFVDAINSVGVMEQNAEKVYYKVETPFEYQASQTSIRMEPSDHFEVTCEIDYDHPLLKNQVFTFSEKMNYEKEIAPARTYCFDYEIEALKKKGLAKGGSLDNAIVVGPTGIYNPDAKLRFENEFVRHKILDLMGDLMLIGRPLQARVIAKRCGHGHNIKFLKQLLAERPLSKPLSV